MPDHLSSLIGGMTPLCRGAVAHAANLCVLNGHHEVDIEHLLISMIDAAGCDVDLMLARSGAVAAPLRAELETRIRSFRTVSERTPTFSGMVASVLEKAQGVANDAGEGVGIRTGHVLLALIERAEWRPALRRISRQLVSLNPEEMRRAFMCLGCSAAECQLPPAGAVRGPVRDVLSRETAPTALDRFTADLTTRAQSGELDPVVGRERETLQLINILCRRRQNNPLLVGDAGVGKTAVVEGLALAIARNEVPDLLRDTEVRVLDLGLLQAGASVKGEFENRLTDLLAAVTANPRPVVLFIDEAHTLVGAGGTPGQNDAANLLKPALARGELRAIAATTWTEYKRYLEKDAALSRRFQLVKVAEPDEALAADMLRAIVPSLERHSGLRITDQAVRAAVAMSARYIPDRQLPDKAIAVLDTAVASVMLSRCEPHPGLVGEQAALARAWHRANALTRDVRESGLDTDLLEETSHEVDHLVDTIADRQRALTLEAELVDRLDNIGSTDRDEIGDCELREDLKRQLVAIQGDAPLLPQRVTSAEVAAVVSDWTGIPVRRLARNEAQGLAELGRRLAKRVVGQASALTTIADHMRTARMGLADPRRPAGVFLLVGPSGVGKTETALALADALLGSEAGLITVNMSEYQEAHSVAGLKGAPAGYVGYGDGGTLTEAVRRQPYAVLLLDEVEKAHTDVLELFYQVFDRGYMADAEGREVDFRHTTIVLTSNVGSAVAMQACLNKPEVSRPSAEALLDVLRPHLYKAFKPAFLGRMNVLPYFPLTDRQLEIVVESRLQSLRERVKEGHSLEMSYPRSLCDWVLSRCKEADAGARDAIRIIDGEVATAVAKLLISVAGRSPSDKHVRLSINKMGLVRCRFSKSSANAVAHV